MSGPMTKCGNTRRHWFPLSCASPSLLFLQKCKQWILRHVSMSAARTAATGRYLAALANSYSSAPAARSDSDTKATSTRRKRLHLLYIVNDALYHVTCRGGGDDDARQVQHFAESIEPSLVPLVTAAASFSCAPKHIAKIRSLLDLWAEKGYYSDLLLAQLRAAVDKGTSDADKNDVVASATAAASGSSSKTPFLMPAAHGDPATPWYDLPAANWLAVLEPNSTRPMNPAALKPLKMTSGPAPPALVARVQSLLADVERMFGEGDAAAIDPFADIDLDALGEHVEIDAFNGDVVGGDSYYGWSRAFCKSIKERGQPKGAGVSGTLRGGVLQDRGRSGYPSDESRSPSPVSPRPAAKKRRYSDSSRQSRSRSRSRSYSDEDRPNDASLHVPSRDYRRPRRPRSRSRSRSYSKRHSRSRSRSRPRSRSPRRDRAQPHGDSQHYQHHQQHFPRGPGAGIPGMPLPGIPPYAHQGPGMPIPPPPVPGAFPFVPPPPGYQGPWPPPLPSSLPPPPHFPQHQQQQWPQPMPMPMPMPMPVAPQPGPNTSMGGWAGGWTQNTAPPQHYNQPPHHQFQNNSGRGGRGGWSGGRW